jgi:NTE family protein
MQNTDLEMKSLHSWMSEGPYTLALSSSFFGFYAHCGVVMALYEQGLLPEKITGASAGALIGAAMASGHEPQVIRGLLLDLKKSYFWDPYPGFGYLRGARFLQYLGKYLSPSFSDLKIPLELAVFDIFTGRTRFLTHGSVPEAVVASCAVPLMFHPRKVNGRWLWDGGLLRKSGMKHEETEERILCIFFESEGWLGAWDRSITVRRLSKKHRILRFKGLPKVDQNSLDQGHAALSESYQRAQRAFAGSAIPRVHRQIVDA